MRRGLKQFIRERIDGSRQAMERLGDVRFVNLTVDAGTVYQLKSILCLLSNPPLSEQPVEAPGSKGFWKTFRGAAEVVWRG
jgi:hypothetical protein